MLLPHHVHQIIQTVIAQEQLPDGFEAVARDFYVPLSDYVAMQHANMQQTHAGPLIVGINGAQGTGKSTLSILLRALLHARQLQCVVISIDDLYLTQAERARLAHEVHPLLRTRGVPGTHDLALGLALMSALKAAHEDSRINLPRFDKARDERSPEPQWRVHRGAVDVIVLEGWCVGARPVSLAGTPINALEQEYDADGAWRAYIESQLLNYQQLFNQIDLLVMLKAPSMDSVVEWRTLQEQKLRKKAGSGHHKGIMGNTALRHFIMHYERLTRYMLDTMPGYADAVCYLDEQHRIARVSYRDHTLAPDGGSA